MSAIWGHASARRPRRARRASACPQSRALVLTLALLLLLATAGYAQSAATLQPPADSVHRIRPGAAFWRSLLFPGWGQAATGRWVTGATFTAWEGVCIMMTFKTKGEVRHIEAIGASHVATKKQEVQDWAVLWIFNHLFAGAEAFVSAHLQDFPQDLHIRAAPGGFMVSLPLPLPRP